MSIAIHTNADLKGLEVGSGGTARTVGVHGGGLCIDLQVDKNYSDARKRWESGLVGEDRDNAIRRERAVVWYYSAYLKEADPADPDGSIKQFDSDLELLVRCGWQIVERRIENNPMLTHGKYAMWAELRKMKTRQEQEL